MWQAEQHVFVLWMEWDIVLEPLQQDKGNVLIIYNGLWMGLIVLRRKGQSKGRRCKADANMFNVRENSPTSSPDKKSSVRETISQIQKITRLQKSQWQQLLRTWLALEISNEKIRTSSRNLCFFPFNKMGQPIHLLPHHPHHPHHGRSQT